MAKSLFNRKKNPIFVETKVLVLEESDSEWDSEDIIFTGETQEMVETWTTSFINVDKIIAITRSPEYSDRSIIWIEFGNLIVQEDFEDALEWLKVERKRRESVLIDTKIKISGGTWAKTRIDLSKCYMISVSGQPVVWFKEEKIAIDGHMGDLKKILRIK